MTRVGSQRHSKKKKLNNAGNILLMKLGKFNKTQIKKSFEGMEKQY